MKRNPTPTTRPVSCFASCLLFLSGITVVNGQSPGNNPVLLRDGVVINAARSEIYVTSPDTTVKAISLSSGRPVWTTNLKGKPLAISNADLIVQEARPYSRQITIVNLDLQRSGREKFRTSLSLSDKVKTGIIQSPTRNFRVWAKPMGGQLNFYWDYTEAPKKGMIEPGADSVTAESGAFRLDINSRRISAINKSLVPESTYKQSVLAGREKQIPNMRGQQFSSRDDRTVLVSEKIAGDTVFNAYKWEFFDIGKNKLGEIVSYRSSSPFIISGRILIYETGPYTKFVSGTTQETPLQIVAVDLSSGKEIWRTSILDTIYRGPTPP